MADAAAHALRRANRTQARSAISGVHLTVVFEEGNSEPSPFTQNANMRTRLFKPFLRSLTSRIPPRRTPWYYFFADALIERFPITSFSGRILFLPLFLIIISFPERKNQYKGARYIPEKSIICSTKVDCRAAGLTSPCRSGGCRAPSLLPRGNPVMRRPPAGPPSHPSGSLFFRIKRHGGRTAMAPVLYGIFLLL